MSKDDRPPANDARDFELGPALSDAKVILDPESELASPRLSLADLAPGYYAVTHSAVTVQHPQTISAYELTRGRVRIVIPGDADPQERAELRKQLHRLVDEALS